jgi:hypothetical protein
MVVTLWCALARRHENIVTHAQPLYVDRAVAIQFWRWT